MKILRLLLATLVCCSPLVLWGQTVVNLEKAGTLSKLIEGTEKELKLSGPINGTDVKYLRQLITEGSLTSLDISEAKIVRGGAAYYESYKTEADVIGQCMFTGCSNLQTIVLPSSISAILTNAFSKSGIRQVDIPNSVSRLGGDAFAYCSSLSTVVIGSRVSRLDQGVFYSSPVTKVFAKPLTPPATPAYLFSSNPSIRVYTEALADYRQSGWKQYGTLVGKLEDYYPLEKDSSDIVNEVRSTFFEDAACTTLKAAYQSMDDEALTRALADAGMPAFMTDIALKLKNGQWAAYEQDFRIHSYHAYSDASYWNDRMKSTGGSFMGNPTGIYVQEYEPLYVFVDDDVPEGATLYIAGCVDNDLIYDAKAGTKLKKGLTIINGTKGALYYILYTADTKSKTKPLSQWPELKIHIEGGVVNGYYDLSRHSDKDYRALLNAATHQLFTVRGAEALFNFKTQTYRKVWPSTIDKSICWFDSLTVWEKELMGFCESVASGQRAQAPYCLTGGESIFPLYYNNPNFAIEGESGDAGWANSTPYRTSYNSQECVSASFNVSRSDHDDWCAAHECGHNNQRTINLEGGTEVSNNLFSNVVRYLTGRVTSSGEPLSTTMSEFASHVPYSKRGSLIRMYYQLYLYYHQARKNTAFYPTLFQELRRDPLVLWNNTNNSSLKFVRKVCEVTQEDLTDFFAAWGFFEPCTNLSVEDYGSHTMTVRQVDINRTLAAISKYPKNRQILFVEDRVDYVLTSGFLARTGQKRRDSDVVGQYGDLGQFTDFLPGACQPSDYAYLQSDSLYAMDGTGGVGFLALDAEGKMVYAANTRCFCIPTSVGNDFTLYSVDADGTLHEAILAGDGASDVYLAEAGTLQDSLSAKAIKATIGGVINGSDIKYLRQLLSQGNLQSIDLSQARVLNGGVPYYETYRSAANAIGNHAFYGCQRLIAMRLPESIKRIESAAFANSGLREAVVPEGVTAVGGDAFAYCKQLTRVVVSSTVKTMGQGVFYSSPVGEAFVLAKTPPSVASYLFSSKPVIHVYASALAAYEASPWADYGTLVGDLDDHPEITSVEPVREQVLDALLQAPVFDLMGRRVKHLMPATIYIRNGKKFMLR